MTAPEIINKVKNLPPISQAALKLVNLLEQASISNDEIVQVIKCDNVLTAKLLRACNSPYFGLDEPVSSVDQAVLLLGHQQILHIVLTLAFGSAMVVPLPGLCGRSQRTLAALAHHRHGRRNRGLAAFELNVETPVAFTVGLLHDIGKLALARPSRRNFSTIRQCIEQESLSRTEAEKKILGADHGEIGACLLKSWNLPEEIIEAVANHHQPVCEPRPRCR
jgi:putative nucleotidyltransferase with HDIG domain